jgi:hypothetical protein
MRKTIPLPADSVARGTAEGQSGDGYAVEGRQRSGAARCKEKMNSGATRMIKAERFVPADEMLADVAQKISCERA